MTVHGVNEVVIDCRDPEVLAGFWATVFTAAVTVRDTDWAYIESPLTPTRIAFQRVPEPKTVKNRVHLDIDVDDITVEAERLEVAGATVTGPVVTDDQGRFQVLLDPEGNEFCLVTDG